MGLVGVDGGLALAAPFELLVLVIPGDVGSRLGALPGFQLLLGLAFGLLVDGEPVDFLVTG